MKKVIIASDHGAIILKSEIVSFLKTKNCSVKDMGVNSEDSVDYPDVAVAACAEFKRGGYDFGILLCGSGIGMSIVANKIKGIRCAQVFDLFTAEMAKAHNNANFIAFGGRVKYSAFGYGDDRKIHEYEFCGRKTRKKSRQNHGFRKEMLKSRC